MNMIEILKIYLSCFILHLYRRTSVESFCLTRNINMKPLGVFIINVNLTEIMTLLLRYLLLFTIIFLLALLECL